MSKKYLKLIGNILKYTAIFLVGAIILTLILLSNEISNSKKYYQQINSGKSQLNQAIASVKKQKYSEAEIQSTEATKQFNLALASLTEIRKNKVAAYFMPVSASMDDLEYLTKTAEIVSRSVVSSTAVLSKLETITDGRFTDNFSNLSTSDRQQIFSTIYQSAPELNGLKANLQLSIENLDKIHQIGILLPVNSRLNNIKSQLTTAVNLLDQIIPLTQLLPSLAGYPQESKLLFILQNNDELRPTGGFIGTYGLMTIKDGKPSGITTEDVYHLDMPCIGKLKTTPPDPIKKYMKVDYWWLRDANWSPDFPTAAKQIETMFLAESQCAGKPATEPIAVIAINPNLITNFLSLVGPITVEGTTYDSNNFQPLLQYAVEVGYADKNVTSWNRKEVINTIIAELEKRLMAMPAKRWPEILNIFQENAARRNLQIYFNDNNQEQVARQLNITGEIKNTDSDYLMVIDANLAAYKSDSVVRKNIAYQIKNNGDQLATNVTLTYKHEGDFNWRTTRYRSYTRIYAPLGSRLIDSGHLDDFSVTDDAALNKTVFGFFWTIEPGTEKTATISYYLPNKINTNNYELYFQKQSGSRLNEFKFTKNFSDKKPVTWSGTLDRDKIFQQ